MIYTVFDVEADGLIEEATRIHCLCCTTFNTETGESESKWTTVYDHMRSFFQADHIIVGHNIARYDIPLVEKLLGIQVRAKFVDTLGLSWYLYPNRSESEHNLEDWGTDLGIEKPKIKDWKNQSVEDYVHRCTVDVKINSKLFHKQLDYLIRIYEVESEAWRFMFYQTFKLKCAAEQEEIGWPLAKQSCEQNLQVLIAEQERRAGILREIMPETIQYTVKSYPKKPFKQDGTLSATGYKWRDYLLELGLPETHTEDIRLETGRSQGNPGSIDQIKAWLFSLGWVPDVYKPVYEYLKDANGRLVKDANGKKIKTGNKRRIPQISKINEPELSDSVIALFDDNPGLDNLQGYFMVIHRIGILNGFLSKVDSKGYLKAEISGFANTMRFKHCHPLVNLPTVAKPYGEEIRGVLVAPEGHVMCGADVSGLEDQTKRHYIYFFDPEYVKEMSAPGFDPHLDIAIRGNLVTEEESDFYKYWDKQEVVPDEIKSKLKNISKRRKYGKQANFSCTYGAYPPKIAEASGMPIETAKIVFDAYWKRNHAIASVSKNVRRKTVDGQMWLKQPVSKFWYSLRAEKDIFSTLNQSTGVYVFDTWVRKVREKGIRICGQFHDEIAFYIVDSELNKQQTKQKLEEAMEEVNKELNLNVKIGVSVKFGDNYADIH